MTLVLMFGVQGITEALTTPTITSTPTDLSTLYPGDTITLAISGAYLNMPGVDETLTVAQAGTIGTAPTAVPALGVPWAEVGDVVGPPAVNGTIAIPSSVTLTLDAAAVGTVTITVSVDGGAAVQVLEFYVVTRPADLVGEATDLAAADCGVHYVYDNHEPVVDGHFLFAPAANAPVYYSVTGGTLYLRDATAGSPTRERILNSREVTSSSADVFLRPSARTTSRVTAAVATTAPQSIIFIYHGVQPPFPSVAITGGNNQTGSEGGRLEDPLVVKVTDSSRRPVAGVAVAFDDNAAPNDDVGHMFIPVPGTEVYTDAADALADPLNAEVTPATASNPAPAAGPIYVRTDSRGEARIYYQVGTGVAGGPPDARMITATLACAPTTIDATFNVGGVSDRAAKLEIVSGDNQRASKGDSLGNPLVVQVRDLSGHRIPHILLQFRSITGTFTRTAEYEPWIEVTRPGPTVGTLDIGELPEDTPDPISGQQVYVKTNAHGEAAITYNVGQTEIARDVIAEVRQEIVLTGTAPRYNFTIDRVVFKINGGGGGGAPPPPPQTITPSLAITTTGEGATRSVTVTATNAQGVLVPGLPVTLSGTALTSPQQVITGTPTPITLPTTPNTYTLQAIANGYTVGTASITVAAPPSPGTLTISTISPTTGGQLVTVTARRNGAAQSGVNFTISGPGIVAASGVTTANGSGNAILNFPTIGTYILTVSADDYTDLSRTVTITTTEQQPPTTEGSAGAADRLEIDGQRLRSGIVNEPLDAPLRVRVIDANGRGVSGDRVTFRVLSPAQGAFVGARGRGTAVLAETDQNGYASATFTPTSGGDVVVRASTGGLNPVTFILNINGVSERETDTGTPGPDVPPSGEISPVVHVGAANRPPMLWVDGGKIYALVGADVQEFGSGIEGAMNVAIGGGKVYWTEQTGESSGTINRANLNGTGVTELASILAVPMGIAVDAANSKLYWTNSRGRIQRANLDGSKIQNVLQNLPSPMDIALSGGNAYWTQGGNVRMVNLSGTKRIRNISTGADAAMSLAISGGKVYWTERTGQSAGTINRANLDGSAVTQLASIKAVPMGIAVDGARSKIFWTNSRGRVQSANLDGSKIQNVVDGLGMPGDMLLSNSVGTPTAAKPTTTTQTTQTTDTSKYDVNADGVVDNTDASLVSTAMNTTNAKYDVNGDGVVNFLDLLLVFDNRDTGAASAPTIVGMKLSAVQIDTLQEQINLLIATGDRSPAAMRTLIYLQQLIATARPEKTQLLANYPNPFNPETWIPYELATDTNVKITIYNTQGVVIRTLTLGHQSAGYYTGRDQAAYWDGRNAFGEQVASGIYFYQFETDDLSLMRKMVILK